MNKKSGFTLVEMLTVVLIIGILTSVALPQYRKAIQKARWTEAMQMLRTIYDSSERLALASGYRDYEAMLTANDPRAVVNNMDMFAPDATACNVITGRSLVCGEFEYSLVKDRIYAVRTTQNDGTHKTQLVLHRAEVPTLGCIEGYADRHVCDVLNIPVEADTSRPKPIN